MTDTNADHDDVDAQHDAEHDDQHTGTHDHEQGNLADLGDPGHLFDQTNGLAEGLNGDSDGTAEADDTPLPE